MSNREEFEKEFKLKWEVGHYILKMVKFIDESNDYAPINAVKTMSDEYYWVLALNTGWWAWQSRVPEGYVVVPKEPSDFMRCTVRDYAPDIEDYENMSKWDWEKLCAEIYKAMIEAVEK